MCRSIEEDKYEELRKLLIILQGFLEKIGLRSGEYLDRSLEEEFIELMRYAERIYPQYADKWRRYRSYYTYRFAKAFYPSFKFIPMENVIYAVDLLEKLLKEDLKLKSLQYKEQIKKAEEKLHDIQMKRRARTTLFLVGIVLIAAGYLLLLFSLLGIISLSKNMVFLVTTLFSISLVYIFIAGYPEKAELQIRQES